MDISDFDTSGANEGAVMIVLHPVDGTPMKADDGNDVTITLAGIDSERYRQAQRENANRLMEQQQRGGRRSADDVTNDARRVIVACTLGWHGFTEKGAPFELSSTNADKLYQRLPWLLEQAQVFVTQRGNFMKASRAT